MTNIKYLWTLMVLVLLAGCSQPPANDVKKLTGKAIGTSYSILYIEGDTPLPVARLEAEFTALVDAANQSMSTYHKDSEITHFNEMQSTESVKASVSFRTVVAEGIRLYEMTDGALDITLKPLSRLWGFGPNGIPHTIPDDAALADVRKITGVDKLTLKDKTLTKSVPQLEVDLNTVGKGFLVDQTAELLESLNVQRYLVEIGGEMRLKGRNGSDKPWRIGVVNPSGGTPKAQRAVFPGNNGVATSGDYYQYFEKDGVRYSHILDPATGKPIRHNLASVTVLHPSSMTADGLATAIMVMGADKGLALAEKHNFAVYLIIRHGNEFVSRSSTAFEAHLSEGAIDSQL